MLLTEVKQRQCQDFFRILEDHRESVTFSEVRLRSGYSEVHPNDVSVKSRFSRNVPVHIPIVSAAMSTVTESRLAIRHAKCGGIGVLHRGASAKWQGDEARRVKYNLSGKIVQPIWVRDDMTLEEVENMRREKRFSFHSFPVLDAQGKLVGLITETDFDFGNPSQRIADVMTRDLIAAHPSTTINEAYAIMLEHKKKVLPLVDGCSLAGMYLFSDLKRIKSGTSEMLNVDDQGRLRVAAAVGVHDDALARLEALRGFVDALVIDTAHGDSEDVFQTLRELKRASGTIDVVAGNVSEGASARRLVECGADGVKVGQGPGSICTTRVVAGIGNPQVSAVYSVAKALEEMGRADVPICADGGIEYSGDIPIAIGAGAHTVMLGKLLARTEEAPGEVISRNGVAMKYYYGMGSLRAMEESDASRERYHEAATRKDNMVPEGVEGAVPFAGKLAAVLHQLVGGLRRGMGYVGAATIAELRQKADFNRISAAGYEESKPHGIYLLRDAPNWTREE